MLSKFLKSNGNETRKPLLDEPPRPADFEIGSDKSRAAARALSETKKSGRQNVFRVVIECIARPSPARFLGWGLLVQTSNGAAIERNVDTGLAKTH